MSIKALEYDAIAYITDNLQSVKDKLQTQTFEEILNNQFGIGWYKKSKIIKPQIFFVTTSKENPKSTDYQNAVNLYTAMINLTESQASDRRLWSGFAIEPDVYEYLKYRWKDTEKTIRYRVVYHAKGKRGLMYHGLARLWWFAHITYDEKRDNPFELTKFAFDHPHILEKMIYRNFSNSDNIRIGIIEGIKQYIEDDGVYAVKKIDALYVYISTLGSVSLIDSYSKKEIKTLTTIFLHQFDTEYSARQKNN